mgnify:FL=1
MKSYLQGIITGGALVFAIFMFMGGSNVPDSEPIGRYVKHNEYTVLDTKTGDIITIWSKENVSNKKEMVMQIDKNPFRITK